MDLEAAPSEPAASLVCTPLGQLRFVAGAGAPDGALADVAKAFARSHGCGLLRLSAMDIGGADLSPSLHFGRELARRFFAALCAVPDLDAARERAEVPEPDGLIDEVLAGAPFLVGGEYLSRDTIHDAWRALTTAVREELAGYRGTAAQYLHERNPALHTVGRVCFHLAENPEGGETPFAFLATYARAASGTGKVKHVPLGRLAAQRADEGKNRELLDLLEPVERAATTSEVVQVLTRTGELFSPLAWTPEEAHAFLHDVPACEAAGVVVRVPDWWKQRSQSRPQVTVTMGQMPQVLDEGSLMRFDVALTIGGRPLSDEERAALLAGSSGLRMIRGDWVEVDAEKLREVLERWEKVRAEAGDGKVSFLDGMRMLAGMPGARGKDESADEAEWVKLQAGQWLADTLGELNGPGAADDVPGLQGTLRPYQQEGVRWLSLLTRLGLGACLADDMGLGKTIQVLALLLAERARRDEGAHDAVAGPHLLVVPASLLGNWQQEADRFAPSLRLRIAHTSACTPADLRALGDSSLDEVDLVVTTYGTLVRQDWMVERAWGLVILDESQAIKNPDTRQSRACRKLNSRMRIALTGTPIENSLSDLWTLFDFICSGLLGGQTAFAKSIKAMGKDDGKGFAPLRKLVRPYILRRLKTDKSIIQDLPDKTEVNAYCGLSDRQVALYQQSVAELKRGLEGTSGMKRRGAVLAALLRFKQICNHPSHFLGELPDDGGWRLEESGKLQRLTEICEPIVARQQKMLVFTQYRESIAPLANFLEQRFGRAGLVLHGNTPIKTRAERVAQFQSPDGPPFFVLSLKAGGTGLNLTAAAHVVHFDRWWNPAVENQATDRAYRIGQHDNVLVHKLICKGTVEEKIDELIEAKRGLSEEILTESSEAWLTELGSEELLGLVSLDLSAATASRSAEG